MGYFRKREDVCRLRKIYYEMPEKGFRARGVYWDYRKKIFRKFAYGDPGSRSRISRKKYWKTQSNRAIRRLAHDISANRGSYKKYFEYWWQIW